MRRLVTKRGTGESAMSGHVLKLRSVRGLILVVFAALLSVVLSLGTPLAWEPSPTMHAILATDRLAVVSTAANEPAITEKVKKAGTIETMQLIPSRFLDARGFSWMLSQRDDTEVPFWRTRHPVGTHLPEPIRETPLLGLVLPHHDVASPMTARILSEVTNVLSKLPPEQQPETIILMGPNHTRSGNARIQTFAGDWETPTGVFPVAQDWQDVLVREYEAQGDPSLMEREHSLSYLVPWLHHAFPETSFLPVLIHGNLDRKGCERLSKTLAGFIQERRTLVIASVDFSHGLSSEDALAADETTWRHVESGAVNNILRLDNRFLDAPPTMATMMLTMSTQKAEKPYLAGHAEASLFLKKPLKNTTSYLCIAYPVFAK